MEKIRTIRKGYFQGWVGVGGGIGRGLKASLIAHSQIEYISYMFSQTRGATKPLHFHGKMTSRKIPLNFRRFLHEIFIQNANNIRFLSLEFLVIAIYRLSNLRLCHCAKYNLGKIVADN